MPDQEIKTGWFVQLYEFGGNMDHLEGHVYIPTIVHNTALCDTSEEARQVLLSFSRTEQCRKDIEEWDGKSNTHFTNHNDRGMWMDKYYLRVHYGKVRVHYEPYDFEPTRY